MSTSRHMTIVCIVAAVLALTFVCGLVFALMTGTISSAQGKTMGYEDKVFDTSKVHSIDIEMDDWNSFIDTCSSEEYSPCSITIDGEKYDTVGIRGKGNTSLSTVESLDSDRYSFKVEFGHYSGGVSYHGLDKLSLNNTIQDTTYMKDYLTYRAMAEFGVDAPLCSYAWITVSGEDWGLYLVVEGVEDSFLQRNYGSDYGELYKPDSMSFGGGRGNGAGFDMDKFEFDDNGGLVMNEEGAGGVAGGGGVDGPSESVDSGNSGNTGALPSSEGKSQGGMPQGSGNGMPDFSGGNMPGFSGGQMPDFSSGNMPSFGGENGTAPDFSSDNKQGPGGGMPGGGMPGGGMGSQDVKLQYIDDDPDSYSNIFDNAKTATSGADKNRLISSIKQLSSYENLNEVVNVDEVIRYFVVHDFVCNGDSYTGSMVHNYYLYEDEGQLSMIPWDYNLAFGTFQTSSDATSTVNEPIDTPVSGGDLDSRPMVGWIFSNGEYTSTYHSLYAQFLKEVNLQALIDETSELIAPYVQKDSTAFYSYEEFQSGVAALKSFCNLRSESITGQLNGTIPSTKDGQSADSSSFVDGSALDLSDMGSMGGMGAGGQGGPGGGFPGGQAGGNGFPTAPGQGGNPSTRNQQP